MCKTDHPCGSVDYGADPGCQHKNRHVEIHGHLLEDERVSVSSLFAKVLRTDDTDHIPYSCLHLPCSFAHLLALLYFPFCSILSFFLQQLICIVSISRERERGSLAQGITRRTDRRFFFPPASPSFEVLINGVFIKVLRGTYTW